MTGTPSAYSRWTRRAVTYVPVHRQGRLIGYLWASVDHYAAGFERHLATAADDLDCLLVWERRLDDAARRDRTPQEAVQEWVGAPEDAVAGAIPPGVKHDGASDLAELWDRLNPDGPPLGDGPLVQDGAYPDGTPADRRDGWGPLHSVPLRTYVDDTDARIRYLPVRIDAAVVGYLWAAATGEAGGYLPRADAGRTGQIAAGLWQSRFSDAYLAGQPATTALARCRDFPADRLSGVVEAGDTERQAHALAELQRLAAGAVDDSL
ncbi:hypothetical protein [Nocardia vulneris]|uniref:hypothetical protein n=1 Tax=Nocardia vulneris TaxID=1141657 RepID=UPI00068D317B|nr:hypothetical protein [Nocardia vulneris]